MLIILAGISIAMLSGDNGIIAKATKSKTANEEATDKEEIKLSYQKATMDEVMGAATTEFKDNFEDELQTYDENATVVEKNEKYKVTINGRIYEVDKEINITKLDETTQTATITNATTNTHTATTLTYTWEEMNKIAKAISDNYGTGTNQINNDTEEVTLTIDGTTYTVGVGDKISTTYRSASYVTRILGFNHDELTSADAYNDDKRHTYAGISFEFEDELFEEPMNISNRNEGGWGECHTRGYLNDSYNNKLIGNHEQVKQVKKTYRPDGNTPEKVETSDDYLWLLSYSEIYNNGDLGTYGYGVGKEGEQYKYYNKINATYNIKNESLIKKASPGTDGRYWWLRSIAYRGNDMDFGGICEGLSGYFNANHDYWVSPGFAI